MKKPVQSTQSTQSTHSKQSIQSSQSGKPTQSVQPAQNRKLTKTKKNPLILRLFIYTLVLLIVFLLGFIPVWLLYRNSGKELVRVKQQANWAGIENALAAGVITVYQGDYESSLSTISNFFTALQEEINKSNSVIFSRAEEETLHLLLTRRDEIITLLARGDSVVVNQLFELYTSFRKTIINQ